jgi:hypothetical protein
MPKRSVSTLVVVVAVAGVFACSVSSALAAEPWWQLSSGARPTDIVPGSGKPAVPAVPEVQEITDGLVEFEGHSEQGGLALTVGRASRGEFITEPTAAELGFAALDESAIKTALEGSYGPGVRVHEEIVAGMLKIRVETQPGVPSIAVSPLGLGDAPEAKVVNPGKAEVPATPDGYVVLVAENLGDAPANGAADPVRISDVLPAGLKPLGIGAAQVFGNKAKPIPCEELAKLTCNFSGSLPSYEGIEIRIPVDVEPDASSGALNQAAISGGGAPAARLSRPVVFGSGATPFGVEDYRLDFEEEGGALATQAGSHPFQVTGTVAVNQGPDSEPLSGTPSAPPAVIPKDVDTLLPAGQLGNPKPLPTCSLAQFLTIDNQQNECPAQTAIGVSSVTVYEPLSFGTIIFTQPIFNLEPASGEPARFGFLVGPDDANVPVALDTSVRSGAGEGAIPGESEDYGVDVSATNISQTAGVLNARVTFWGTPGDPRHDSSRGWGCLAAARGEFEVDTTCNPSTDPHPPAFLTLPTSCSGPLQTSVRADSWVQPGVFQDVLPVEALQSLDGCNKLLFSPAIAASPTSDSASSPSGLDFNLNFHDEGLLSEQGLAQSQLKDTTVTLPEGFTINPSSGVGLAGCTPADYARETVDSAPGAGCPNESKLGTVEIQTPLLSQTIHGSLFIAQPHENPFNSLVALYIVAKNPETGVLIKLAGKVTPDPVTGQLTTTFENNPQLPFDHFNFHFREGDQAPLITPATCGTYTTTAQLTPWSDPTSALTETSSFTITSGVGGGLCPSGGVPQFSPRIQAGTLNNNAGAFSAFYLHLTRGDADQEITGFSTSLPPGLTGDLTGIPFCPEADIAAARTKTGAQEEASPSCPAASQIGHTLVGTGVGAVLAYVPGKVYLGGPFDGAPFSLVSVTSAVVGPFDLGTVVLRFGLNINPYTAQVSVSPTSSEPIPTIIQGIVTHVRDIRVYIERPGNAPFTLNPTSCDPMAIGSTLTSSLKQNASITSPFQTANCANLKFAPKFTVSTQGRTSKANGASLAVKLTYPSGVAGTYANIAKVKVELPKQLPSRLTTLQKACTAAQFEANPADCPTPSVIGTAKAVVPNIPEPLTGPVYFVSHGGEAFPSLEIVLQGYGVKVILVGATFISKAGITSTTFKAIPDNPVTSFELTLPEGKYSALAANGNLCSLTKTVTVKKRTVVKVHGKKKTVTRSVKQAEPQTLALPTEFTAQNGAVVKQTTPVSVTGCAKAKPTKKKRAKKGKRAKPKHAGKK